MPGHKMGRGLPGFFRKNMPAFDLTEIPGLDNLHFSHGIICRSQRTAARIFGADRTFFLVNGSTAGVHAAVMALCNPTDRIILQRDCHRSAASALMLAGAQPVFMDTGYCEDSGLPLPPTAGSLISLAKRNPGVKALFLTRPGYYGQCSNLRELVETAHSLGIPVIVDEAHGAHLAFSGRLPECAMHTGADICIQSAHKTLPALTQGAFIHTAKHFPEISRLEKCLRMLQTSSPSYIIMASLEYAANFMSRHGEERISNLLLHIARLKCGLKGAVRPAAQERGIYEWDETRLVFDMRGLNMTGFEAERILREKYGIQVEMSDSANIVCITTVADGRREIAALRKALVSMEKKHKAERVKAPHFCWELPEHGLSLSQAKLAVDERVKLDKCEGRISADFITPFPPGVPVLWPGEVIDKDMISKLGELLTAGGTINGISTDGKVSCICENSGNSVQKDCFEKL